MAEDVEAVMTLTEIKRAWRPEQIDRGGSMAAVAHRAITGRAVNLPASVCHRFFGP
jgi:hypothetical protein